MDIYRLPGDRMPDNAKGLTEIPDILVVGDSQFRHFAPDPGAEFPIVFRSDTRDPECIFWSGFQRKKTVKDCFDTEYDDITTGGKKRRLDDARADIVAKVRLAMAGRSETEIGIEIAKVIGELERDSVGLRVNTVDLAVETAVCFTRSLPITALFPFDPKKLAESLAKPTTVFMVQIRSWLETYKLQKFAAEQLAYSEEVASLGVPAEDVLGSLSVERAYKGDGPVYVRVTGFKTNKKAPVTQQARVEEHAKAYVDWQPVNLPRQKDLDDVVDRLAKVVNLKAALAKLTGNAIPGDPLSRSSNRIRVGGTLTELPDYVAPQPPKPAMTPTDTTSDKTKRRLST